MTTPASSATLANWRQHPHSIWGFTHVEQLLTVATVKTGAAASPLARATALDLRTVRLDWEGRSMTADEVLAETFTDGFLLLQDGAVLAERYAPHQQPHDRHIIFSVSKSVTAALAAILAEQGLLDPDAPVTRYVPEATGSAYGDCTVRHVLDMTVSIRFIEDYLDPYGDVARYRVAMGWNPLPPGMEAEGLHRFIARLPKAEHPHGERFHYVSPNTDMLGWIIERAAGETFASLLSRHIWQPMGMAQDAFMTLDGEGAARTAGGLCVSLGDLARIGELMRGRGLFRGRRVLPEAFVTDILEAGDRQAWIKGDLLHLFPEGRYRSQWYVPEASSNVLCAIGIHGQWIYVDFARRMVAVKQSSQPIPADDAIDQQTLALFRALAQHLG
ncbi:MAG: serine hydrolase [Aestuariivirga sp.]|nr:serine hydrolase [Aestuariivirga sp.]